MSARTQAIPLERKWRWPLQDVFGNLRVRFGIKVALSGLLALFATQVLRLPHDSWAILTVLVMTSAQFVGSMAVKAVMRVIGTIAGAIVGTWIVGNYTSTPAIFLPLLFLVMAITSYKFGQVGAAQVPYAYFLLGLTTLTVVTNGIPTPDQAWYIGLTRTEEILVGALSALLVTTVLWPRYAREDFVGAAAVALKSIGEFVSQETEAYAHEEEGPANLGEIRAKFTQQLAGLRNLVQAGSRESTFFSARLSNYNAFVVSTISLFHGALYLARKRLIDAAVVEQMRDELLAASAAIKEEFKIQSVVYRGGQKMPPSSLNEAFAALEQKVIQLRTEGFLREQPLETSLAFAGHFAALRSLRDELNNIRALREGLPRLGQPPPAAKPEWDLLPHIDWFWVKVGIKGALAATIAVVLLMWINPPGPATLTLMAWVLTLTGRPFIRTGGTGDLRAFQNGFYASVLFVGCAALLVATTPFLASYLAMNVALFGILFLFGFLTAKAAGLSFWSQIALLTISAFVGLNPQQPVATETIIQTFLGLITGLAISTVVSRLLWPVLPQTLLRQDLISFFRNVGALLRGDPYQERIRTQLSILSVESLQAVRQVRSHRCSDAERATVTALIHEMQALSARLSHLVSHREYLPPITQDLLGPPFERLEFEFQQMVEAFVKNFRDGNFGRELPTLRGALAEVDQAVQEIRESRILDAEALDAPLRTLDLVGRYHGVADALEECARLIRTLRMPEYWGDYAL